MTKDEALRLALDLLKNAHACTAQEYDNAIKALEAALAQSVQPTGMLHIDRLGKWLEASVKERKRPWVGLTDEDLKTLSDKWRIVYGGWVEDFAQAIANKLKERNS